MLMLRSSFQGCPPVDRTIVNSKCHRNVRVGESYLLKSGRIVTKRGHSKKRQTMCGFHLRRGDMMHGTVTDCVGRKAFFKRAPGTGRKPHIARGISPARKHGIPLAHCFCAISMSIQCWCGTPPLLQSNMTSSHLWNSQS